MYLVSQTIEQKLKKSQDLIIKYIDRILPNNQSKLYQAMRYSALNIGKGIRSYLVFEIAKMYGVPYSKSLPLAVAIELIHTYSLIHDDLPAMDNDLIRRGKPSCHLEFDEATAILAGDSLLTLAFEIISSEKLISNAETKIDIINCLAKAIGASGMAGGQMLDILFENQTKNIDEIINMQKMKTADFIAASACVGAMLGNCSKNDLFIIKNSAIAIGLSFQIVDDILDIEGNKKKIGKNINKDKNAGKATIVDILGLDYAKFKAKEFKNYAINELRRLKNDSKPILDLAEFIVMRQF